MIVLIVKYVRLNQPYSTKIGQSVPVARLLCTCIRVPCYCQLTGEGVV